MKKPWDLICCILLALFSSLAILPVHPSWGKELPKIAVWDLEPRNTPVMHARELTSILVSEINELKKYEVYSQENVRTIAGWTEERMKLGCSSTQCLTALGQMDITKLISGSVGKIGNRYTVSLNLFDTQNAKAENALSRFCQTEDELIELVQTTVRKLLGEAAEARPSEKVEKPTPAKIPNPAVDEQGKSAEKQRIKKDLERLTMEEKQAENHLLRTKKLHNAALISTADLRSAENQLAGIRAEIKKKEEELKRSP